MTDHYFRFRPDLMVEPIESPKKFNMKKVTILDDEEANKSRKSRLKQQRKEDRDDHNDDSEDSGTDFIVIGHFLPRIGGSTAHKGQTVTVLMDIFSYNRTKSHLSGNIDYMI